MALTPHQLNDMDEFILDFLDAHEWAPPLIIRLRYNEENGEDVSSQWVSRRIVRLTEHGHLERVHPDSAMYRLRDDPRTADDSNPPPNTDPNPEQER